MSDKIQILIKRLAVLNALLVICLVALGGFVRGTGAGLSCPDWPLCFGRVVPPTFSGGVFQEYAHRVLAGIVSIVTLMLVIHCFRARRQFPALPRFGMFLIVLLAIQAVMGGLTVILTLNPLIVTAHLVLGTAFFQSMALLALERTEPSISATEESAKLFVSLSALIFLLVFQISLGGFVGSSGASLACPDFPLCLGNFPPQSGGPQHAVFAHGMLGFVIFLLTAYCFYRVLKSTGAARKRKGHMGGVLFLVCAQIIIGIGNIHMAIPVSMAVIHLVLAQLILLGIASLYKDLRGDRYFYRMTPLSNLRVTEDSQMKRDITRAA